jgi:hypothetical protein
MISRSLLAILLAGIRCTVALAEPASPVLPYEPRQLLPVLPSAPLDWKVTRSEAGTTLGEWLQTRATRIFQAPPAPVTAGAPAPQGRLEISVTDTGGFAQSLAAFDGFTPGKIGNLEKKLIGTLPAIFVGSENSRQFIQVLVSSRYIVELTLTDLPRQRVEDWLRAFHFDALPPATTSAPTRPGEYRLSHIDELDPKNNRSYLVSTTNIKRVDAYLKTLPRTPPDSEPLVKAP